MGANELNLVFEEAVSYVKTAKTDFKPSKSLKLKMYAWYKQATEGDVRGKKPGMLDIIGREKYKAWAQIKGMSHSDAMQAYIDEVNSVRNN